MDKQATPLKERIQDVFDLCDSLHGIEFVASARVDEYESTSSDPLVCEGVMKCYVDPYEGGRTQSLQAKTKEMVSDIDGLYITDLESPRQRNGGPGSGETNVDYYSRNPYLISFRWDESDVGDKEAALRVKLNDRLISKRVARRVMGYEPEGDVELMIGELVTQQIGKSDAPKEYFDAVKDALREELGGEIDLDQSGIYDEMNRIVMEQADEFGYVE